MKIELAGTEALTLRELSAIVKVLNLVVASPNLPVGVTLKEGRAVWNGLEKLATALRDAKELKGRQ